ncbi:hypothetical protein FSARC_7698 [Fusarium sarcochroum]|uniref:Uncharacterized protein n=1 Tax=Fusarium sarcochroum TaxID=1208366 RepID=A0A8H4TUT9_9HYPO|nr:hypothetical protein FSARC_7698 [Fusarium sarcochroum]
MIRDTSPGDMSLVKRRCFVHGVVCLETRPARCRQSKDEMKTTAALGGVCGPRAASILRPDGLPQRAGKWLNWLGLDLA